MKKRSIVLLILVLGAISISASKADNLLGKWEVYKMTDASRGSMTDGKESLWLEFKENQTVIIGEGDSTGKQQEWLYEEDNQKLFFIDGNKQEEFEVHKLTRKILIFELKKGRSSSKFFLKKIPS